MPRVSTRARLIDALVIALVVAGASCVAWAYVGLERLRASGGREFTPGMPVFASLAEHARWTRLSWLGFGLIAAGVAVAIIAAVVARRRATTPDSS